MTWVLLLILCGNPSNEATCEDRVVAHNLAETECQALAQRFAIRGQVVECVREAHHADETPEEI